MPDLVIKTALRSTSARTYTAGDLTLEENDRLALASLALRNGSVQPMPFGLNLPSPGKWVERGGRGALWTGIGQWLVEGHDLALTDFADELSRCSPGCSVTEQTDAFVAFDVISSAGERPVDALMSKLVNLDTSSLGPGSATRTGLEHMSVFVIRRQPDHLTFLGMRSAAQSLWHAIEVAVTRLGRP